ncbi:hypothetical protein LCGC14_0652090 [marine sediment metagenome]|uniref:Uncharacterized protein n=1 Tax=marine sediment metagenome TaxID=412755 RepID=A0A0F9THQ1_9ZZZZ
MDDQQFNTQQLDKQLDHSSDALYAGMMREDKVSNILSQINPDNLLTDIEHRIRGEKKDSTGVWVKIHPDAEPVSEEMVSNFISFLGAILNQNTSMSNFKEQEINNMMEMITSWVISDLSVNARKYGIEGQYTEYDRVGHIICATCFAVFKRALNGRESARIFKMLRVTESNSPQKQNKLWDNLKFWN